MAHRLAAAAGGILFLAMLGAARADVVVVVSEHNPIDTLSRSELADIYLGRMNQLPSGEPVVPIDQKETSTTHDEFYNQYLGRSPAQIKAHWSKLIFTGRGQPPRSVSNSADMANAVAADPRAIGYVNPELVDDRLRVVPIE